MKISIVIFFCVLSLVVSKECEKCSKKKDKGTGSGIDKEEIVLKLKKTAELIAKLLATKS